jgi:hypothetical protein
MVMYPHFSWPHWPAETAPALINQGRPGTNGYGLTTGLKVPPNALIPWPFPAGAPAPFRNGMSCSWLNR